MKRRAQAAMEFLMTYGWAVLVVLLAIGALAYFGVLSPQKLLPERTTFTAPLPNVDNAVISQADSTVEIAFKNNKGVGINISTDPADVSVAAGGDCTLDGTNPLEVDYDGTTYDNTDGISNEISNGATFILRFTCTETWTEGDKMKADFSFKYVNSETDQEIPHSGTVDGKVPG